MEQKINTEPIDELNTHTEQRELPDITANEMPDIILGAKKE